ncbi:peptidase inhibitor family I36 protein [Promicromonospora iranensis]|jgi:hypothetical protein|uniref:peptidase inhibitor family I36 protein n=1 Tax=Promicromonospora iranensis TaxID=1105144 RepID=UPI0023A9BF3F|nr:peptidase inhibitor family I36 protein [Promicromonospora iranensis]
MIGKTLRERVVVPVVGALAALLMFVGLGVVAAAPASAARSDCPSGYACTWNNGSFSGGMSSFQYSIPDFGAWPGYNNAATSVTSAGQSASCVAEYYPDANYGHWTGGTITRMRLQPGQYRSDLSNNVYYRSNPEDGVVQVSRTWNDLISSGRFVC